VNEAERLNADCHAAGLDQAALQHFLQVQGQAWHDLVTERCPYLFAAVPVFIAPEQLQQMHEVIAAVERMVELPGWLSDIPAQHDGLGVFYGYDFHLNEQGVHLIEINTNAGGGFLNALLIASQCDAAIPGKEAAVGNLDQAYLDMFRNEWRLARGDVPLKTIAIVDEQPESQYLYPEFLLAQGMFERAGIMAYITDPLMLQSRDDALYFHDNKIDLVYNRLTDFSLQKYPALRQACLGRHVVVTPAPAHYARYADKRNLARLSDANDLRKLGANDKDIAVLQQGVPLTIAVRPGIEDALWTNRKHLFFKPNSGYGSKGAYRGEKLTKRVFSEIMQSDYVAQRLAPPGERRICVNGGEPHALKYDVRCYVYDGKTQLVAARLYQGQTTNFRTPGGGFALIRVVEQGAVE
jgi:hypothetical protein